ncbi:MAG: hypothetical protein ABW092_07550 [Candidatus Thiodiazotropha sp.]
MFGRFSGLLPGVFSLILIMQGCGGGGGSSDNPTDTSDTGNGSNSDQASQLAGRTWQLCNQFSATSTLFTQEYTETGFAATYNTYQNDSCSGTPFTSDEIVSGTYTVGGDVTTTGGVTATELDYHVTSAFGSPLPVADQYSLYDIYYIDNDALYFSDESSTEAQSRPDTIDFSDAYLLI